MTSEYADIASDPRPWCVWAQVHKHTNQHSANMWIGAHGLERRKCGLLAHRDTPCAPISHARAPLNTTFSSAYRGRRPFATTHSDKGLGCAQKAMRFATVVAQVLAEASLALRATGQHTFQAPLQVPGGGAIAYGAYDEGLFTPLGDLSSLSSTTFTRLDHPAFPRHTVRVKQSHFCDEQVRSVQIISCKCRDSECGELSANMSIPRRPCRAYTGYIDIEARHLFFYFFESRRDPDKDDVMFWTNGGPGGSSAIGLFTELGTHDILHSRCGSSMLTGILV